MCDPSYLAWCQHQHIGMHGVQPAYVAEGWRGVVASQQLSPGHVVMTVPQQVLMSVLSARQDPCLSEALRRHPEQLTSHQVVALHLIHEASKGPASKWHAYIQQLPRTYTTFLNWGTAAVQQLQTPYAQAVAAKAVKSARQDWTSTRPVLQHLGVAKKWLSWRAWQWAASAVLSRTMYHPADPDCGCLTPLGDLHNYQPPAAPHTPQLEQDMQQLLMEQQQQVENQQHATTCQPAIQATVFSQQHDQQVRQQDPAEQVQQSERAQSHAHSGVSQPVRQLLPAPAALPVKQPDESDVGAAGSSSSSTSSSSSSNMSSSNMSSSSMARTGLAAVAPSSKQAAEPAAETARAVDDMVAANCDAASMCGDGHFDATEGCYKIVARKRYQPGDQVFLCYGRHTNLELLEVYGFMLADNPHDVALLPPDTLVHHLQEAACRFQQQQQQSGVPGRRAHCRRPQKHHEQQHTATLGGAVKCRHVLDVSSVDCWVHANGQPSWQLLCALRCAAATITSCSALAFKAHCGEPVSLASELLVLQALAGACGEQLALLAAGAAGDLGPAKQPMQPAGCLKEPHNMADTVVAAASAGLLLDKQCNGAKNQVVAGTGDGHMRQLPGCRQVSGRLQPLQPKLGDAAAAQQEQQQAECHELAVRWRQTYVSALQACESRCRALLAAAKPCGEL